MYKLMVSRNQGRNFKSEKQAETIGGLQSTMNKLDAQLIPWYIKAPSGADLDEIVCANHQQRLDELDRLFNRGGCLRRLIGR